MKFRTYKDLGIAVCLDILFLSNLNTMFLLALLVLCCIDGTAIVASPQNTNQTEWLWQLFKANGMGELENFYEFLNRVTHGEIFNISVQNHHLLKVNTLCSHIF